MSDSLTIVDLELETRIGVTAEERAKPQRVLLTITMSVDSRMAAATDDVTKTIDYGEVARALEELAQTERKTIERLAEDAAKMILERFRPLSVTVSVKKFAIPSSKETILTITRP